MEYELEYWPLDKFIDYAGNPRKNNHAVDKMVAAIKEFGFRVPMLARSDGRVVDGHLRLKAAMELKLEKIPVLIVDDLTDTQIKAFRLSVNRVAEEASWNKKLLAVEFEDLKELGFDLALTGFDIEEIEGTDKLKTVSFTAKDKDDDDAVICPECNHEFTP